MRRWKVSGANRETGAPIEIIVEAANEMDAVKKAGATGMLISECVPEGPPPMPPSVTSHLAYATPETPRPKKRAYGLGTLLLVCLGGCCVFSVLLPKSGSSSSSSSSSGKTTPAAPAKVSNEPEGFSAWDGSHLALVRAVKESLHDASSFEHSKTVYWDMKTHIVVRMEYRAKNGFGAMRLTSVKAKCGKDGSLIQIMEAGD